MLVSDTIEVAGIGIERILLRSLCLFPLLKKRLNPCRLAKAKRGWMRRRLQGDGRKIPLIAQIVQAFQMVNFLLGIAIPLHRNPREG
jgi:hypothetical protein